MPKTTLVVSARQGTRVLVGVAIFLVVVSTVGQLCKFLLRVKDPHGWIQLFDVSIERNIPTFFSALLLLMISLQLAAITALRRNTRDRDTRKWAVLSIGFLYMAYDEAFHVHENLVGPMRSLLGEGSLGVFYFAWVIPGIAVVLLLGLYFLGFLRRLPAASRRAFLISAGLYLGGCIGIEMLDGYYVERHGSENLGFNLLSSLEESLEMAGLISFLHALWSYLTTNHSTVLLQFKGASPVPLRG